MRLLWCCILSMVVMATSFPQGTMDNYHDPQNIDTPDDQDEGQGTNVNPQGNPQAGSSYFVPTGDSSSSSSSSEEQGSDAGSVPIGSVPSGTVGPGGSPVVGGDATGGNAAGAGVQGGGRQGGAQGGGNAGSTDQDSGEQSPGGVMRQNDPSFLSKIQAQPKGNTQKSGSAGQSVGIALGVLGLVSVATVGIIFAIRKKRDGFLRFYSQASNEL